VPVAPAWQPPPPAAPLDSLRTWKAVAARLPEKDGWTGALAGGLLAPKSLPGQERIAELDVDVERIPKEEGEAMKVVFPHKPHTVLLGCDTCHPDPFGFSGGDTPMSMAQLEKGEGCGACHGKVAFGVDECGRCHPGLGGS
jgi:c(7)-type cytochrome triheme protein